MERNANAPLMTVTDANGSYEIALEEETRAMLQQHHLEERQTHQQGHKEEKNESSQIEGIEK